MKTRILLCMMVLWAICTAAQPNQHLQPQILDDGYCLLPTPHQFSIKPVNANEVIMKKNDHKKTTQVRSEEPIYQVDFILDFDTVSQRATQIGLYKKSSHLVNSDLGVYQLEKGSNVLSVPAGIYDIIVQFSVLDTTQDYEWPSHSLYVIREQVTINDDLTMNFASSEAKNQIHFQTLTIDGEPVYTGEYTIDENWNWIQIEEGNTWDVQVINYLVCPEVGIEYAIKGNIAQTTIGEQYHMECREKFFDFFINDVSSRYTFYSYRIATMDYVSYSSAYEVKGATNDVTITNDPTVFTLFEDTFFAPNHAGEEIFQSFIFYAPIEGAISTPIYDYSFHEPLANGQTCKYYIGASIEDSQLGFVPYFEPNVSIKTMDWWTMKELYPPVVYGTPLVMSNGQIILANNGTSGRVMYFGDFPGPAFNNEPCEELDWLGRDIKVYFNWPTHPVFSYSIDKKNDNFGNNCPLLVSMAYQSEKLNLWGQIVREMSVISDYIGRYGERPDYTPQTIIYVNGEEYNGPFNNMDAPLSGEIEVNLTNESIQIDNMTGSNKAQLHYIAGAEDENPPTMTMLHFKSINGEVTDRFISSDVAMLEFSAGDFNYITTPLGYDALNRYAPDLVEVSYSPYGEDNWNELTVEEVPENYWPVMGWFYSGSLAGVTGEGLNGWFDLKIRLTDAAGNWQEQVLSPAFRIDDHAYSSVATLHDSNAYEVARYNLAGQHVDTNATGVVIIKMSDGTARKELVP